MSALTVSSSQQIRTVPISALLDWTISTPSWQRFVDPKRVKSMCTHLRQQYQWHPPILQAITLAHVQNSPQYYVIDGQHRFHVYTLAYREHGIDTLLLVNIVDIDTAKGLVALCRFLNDSHPFQVPENVELMEKAKQLVCNLEPILKPYLSSARKPRRPNLSLHQFTEAVVRALQRTPKADTQVLLDAITQFNLKCLNAPVHFFKYPHDKQDAQVERYIRLVRQKAAKYARKQKWTEPRPCFLGMFPNGDWVKKLYAHVDQIVVPPTQCAPTRPRRTKRQAFSKAERIHIWNHYMGTDARQGSCYVCSKAIRIESFECGHMTAVARGGTNALANIRPICIACNRSCGTKNLQFFKRQSVFCNKT